MISDNLPDLSLPQNWIDKQLQENSAPFFIEDIIQGYRLFSPKSGICWFIFSETNPQWVIGKGAQSTHTFAKEYFSKRIAAHGWIAINSVTSLDLSKSEVECLEAVKEEQGVIQNWGHYYHRDGLGFLFRGMITPYYPKKHMEMGKVRRKKKTALYLMDIVRRVNEKGIIHRDIKLKNIFLDDKGKPVLADFGFACKKDSKLVKKFLGNISGLAPELFGFFLTGKVTFTVQCDVWATAVCVYQILFKKYPSYLGLNKWRGLDYEKLSTSSDIVIEILKGMKTFAESIEDKGFISEKLKKMFVYSQEDRPTLTELLPFDNQKEKVKPLDNQRQIVIIQGGVVMFTHNGRMRPAMLL